MKVSRERIYVWEYPVRLTHWINFLGIVVLSVTGLYIGSPFLHATSPDQYIMGWMRFIHFTAAYAFLMSMIIRLYWAVMGNRYASFKTWFPFSKRAMSEITKEFRFYFMISKEPPSVVGHTSFGGFTMIIVFAIFVFEIISGFAMYSVNHSGMLWTVLGGWLIGVISLPTIRLFHHLFMYIILSFAILHIYISWYSDVHEKNSLIGSIFSGYKFVSGKEYDR
jgi:Ni/Fe-hydrogenase 1 B-type cytochrome subunit